MLVLTRKAQQSLIIKTHAQEQVDIHILAILPGGGVKIGVNAPSMVKVLRDDAKRKK